MKPKEKNLSVVSKFSKAFKAKQTWDNKVRVLATAFHIEPTNNILLVICKHLPVCCVLLLLGGVFRRDILDEAVFINCARIGMGNHTTTGIYRNGGVS